MEDEMNELITIHKQALQKTLLWKEIQMPLQMRKQKENDIKLFMDSGKLVQAKHLNDG